MKKNTKRLLIFLAALLMMVISAGIAQASGYRSYEPGSNTILIVVIIVIALVALAIFLHFVPMGLWISSLASGVHVSIGSLVGMRIRRIQPQRLVYPLIRSEERRVGKEC